jgi:hypothetical protein
LRLCARDHAQGTVRGAAGGLDGGTAGLLEVEFGEASTVVSPASLVREQEFLDRQRWRGVAAAAAAAAGPLVVRVAYLGSGGVQILEVEHFLSDEEIDEVTRLGRPLLRPSAIQSDDGDSRGQASPQRTSWTAFMGGEIAWNPTLIALQKRAAIFTGGLPWTHSESLQLVSYAEGQYHLRVSSS